MIKPNRWLLAIVAAFISATTGWVFAAPPARADCIAIAASYQVLGLGPQPLPGACVPTPFPGCVTVNRYAGDPNFVFVDATVTLTCPV